jgi:multiple sugar transport system substrate-binding protein
MFKNKKRWIWIAVAMLALTTAIAGCGGGKSGKQAPASSSADEKPQAQENAKKSPVKLTMWTRTPETVDLLKEAADDFQAETGHTIEVVSFPADQYQAALQAAVSGDNLPDIFHFQSSIPLAQMIKLDLIQPIPFTDEFKQQFDPATWWEGSTTLDGIVYGWPDRSFRRGTLVVFYNKKILRDAGLNADQAPTTWDEFLQQSKEVVSKGDGKIYGVTTGMKASWFSERLVGQLATTVGGGISMETLSGRLFDWKNGTAFTPGPVFEAVKFLEQLKNEKVIHPDFVIMDRPDAAAQFGENQAAFLIDGHWRLMSLKETYPTLEFGLAPLPSKTGTPAYWGVEGGSGNAYFLSKKLKHTDVAVQWFEYLTKHFYPKLLEKAIDLAPVPAINNSPDVEVIPEFRQLIDLIDRIVKVQPSPGQRSPIEIETAAKMLAKTAKEPLGSTVQSYLAGNKFDLEKYLNDYAAEQQKFLEDAVNEVSGAKLDFWKFPNWDINHNYNPDQYQQLK